MMQGSCANRAVLFQAAMVGALLPIALVGGCKGGSEPPAAAGAWPPPKHVILISLDTLRADRLGCYGYERDTSPRLDEFAGESVVFMTAVAQATQTLISHKSLLTAKYPLRLIHEKTNANLKQLAALEEPERFVVDTFAKLESEPLVSALQKHGYGTAAFTDGRWMSRAMQFHRGFDVFNDAGGLLQGILPRVEGWLERHTQRRFFLFIHAYDTHCPYVCREPYNSMFCRDHSQHIQLAGKCGKPDLMDSDLSPADLQAISDHYDGGVASADAYVGELLGKLRSAGIYDEALIIVTSDHGESLGTHEQIGHGGMYLEQLLVPLIVKFPAAWPLEPQRIEQPVELVDVMPTIYDALGVTLPNELDGHSLLPLMRGEAWGRKYALAQVTFNEGRDALTNPAKRAVLEPGRWLLIHDARQPAVELFDLQAEPDGLLSPLKRQEEVVAELIAALSLHDPRVTDGEFVPPETVPIEDDLKQQLEALGYVAP